jgi:hypothetical protein
VVDNSTTRKNGEIRLNAVHEVIVIGLAAKGTKDRLVALTGKNRSAL